DSRMDRFLDEADALVDARFFEALFSDIELSPEEKDQRWARALVEIGERVLSRAIASTPVPAARRYRAIAAAERFFHGSARKQFGDALRPATAATPEETTT